MIIERLQLNSVFDRIQNKNTNFDFSCTADVLSNVVNDRNSFRVYDNMLVSPRIGETRLDTAISYDYPDALYKHLQKVHSLEECKEAIFQIFLEPNKKQIALWRWHDASVFFVSHRYTEYRNLYRGSFNFSIAFSCLKNANDLSEKLIGMAIQASAITSNINARIALSPISSPAPCSAHMMYFGGKVEGDGSHSASGFRSHEWYPYYYFQGAEWFNLLSPFVSSRIPSLVSEAQQYSQIVSTVYPNGIITLQSRKAIDQIDVMDLRDMKILLYPILYPGGSRILLENLYNPKSFGYLAKPRQQWEYLPLFPNEISVDDRCVSFRYSMQNH